MKTCQIKKHIALLKVCSEIERKRDLGKTEAVAQWYHREFMESLSQIVVVAISQRACQQNKLHTLLFVIV